MRVWMLVGSALGRFFFKNLIKVQPFSPAYGGMIVGFLMLLLSPSVVSMCGVGAINRLLKSFLTLFMTVIINQNGFTACIVL